MNTSGCEGGFLFGGLNLLKEVVPQTEIRFCKNGESLKILNCIEALLLRYSRGTS